MFLPLSTHAYFDRVQLWLRTPIRDDVRSHLIATCGHVYIETKPARFNRQFKQRVELKQPSAQAFSWIASRNEALINRADIAIDYCFQSIAEKNDFREFLNFHVVRRWHNAKHNIFIHDGDAGTRYDAPRGARTTLVTYREPRSRVTGELNVIRIEWRATGLRSVRRCGVWSGSDLVGFNHRKFWERNLLLVRVNEERAGRAYLNQLKGKRSRGSRSGFHGRAGHIILSNEGCIQEFIDKYRRKFRVGRALERISVEELLPK